ncbi:hypothetical protein GLYMA_18G238550v4 [Glycine max]|nr:hypothetical protein GLYMA_18G238550v4 [Glycine max]
MRTTKDDHFQKLCRSLFIALCNLAKARSKLKNFYNALQDCDHTLELDATHLKNLLCKDWWVSNGFEGRFRSFKITLVPWRLEDLRSMGDGCFQPKTCVGSLLLVTKAIPR